jgi:acetylornithine deacetylase/succinyl-diaminopimelate desuccinylase-like protein
LNLKFFFEGQEEIGSPQLPEFIAGHRELLACDLVFSADGGQWDEDQPAVLTGLRGLCALQIDVRGAYRDVHSGTYGGAFLNPIHALASIIDSMHSPDGRVAVPGFYDAVRPLSPEERAHLAALPFDESDYKAQLGLSALFGEPGYSTYERTWIRPTLEVNGIWGGFQGEGTKTVIPSLAHAKISCRLVPDQDPAEILTRVTAHVQAHAPEAAQVLVHPFESTAAPYVVPLEHAGNRAAQAVHRKLYGKEPYAVRMGGSIPVCGLLLKHLGAYTIDFAFGLKDENIHAPDEFFRLQSFEKGQRGYAMLLEEVARQGV